MNALSDAQAEFLTEQLPLLPHLGSSGIDEVEGILFRNSLDFQTAINEMNRISSEVQSAIERSNQIRDALSGLIYPYEAPEDEVMIRVVFDHAASIDDVADFKKWANEWHDIGRGIAMSVGGTPKDLRIVGAQTGSIVITIATTCVIARVVASVLLKSLEVAEKVQGLRKMQLEIEALKLSNTQAKEALKAQAVEERKVGLENISKSVSDGLALDGEKITALDKSINKLLGFIEKGGAVDVVLPLSSEDGAVEVDADMQKLSRDVMRIRELERNTRLIAHEDEES
ncbi:hypothetical protein [Thermomonas aquatica]|uniref:Uncharacterized protein n=1 Tax=Thermomonas aquatica TaxID=2202149 RepID=A0A5B7ZPZ3_9GAMM|nr:hypothetical protein [Thermomonas aquatica]QDA57130.1 hypothetical protein FHQ07_07280 [Thermomonas aquatica]